MCVYIYIYIYIYFFFFLFSIHMTRQVSVMAKLFMAHVHACMGYESCCLLAMLVVSSHLRHSMLMTVMFHWHD